LKPVFTEGDVGVEHEFPKIVWGGRVKHSGLQALAQKMEIDDWTIAPDAKRRATFSGVMNTNYGKGCLRTRRQKVFETNCGYKGHTYKCVRIK